MDTELHGTNFVSFVSGSGRFTGKIQREDRQILDRRPEDCQPGFRDLPDLQLDPRGDLRQIVDVVPEEGVLSSVSCGRTFHTQSRVSWYDLLLNCYFANVQSSRNPVFSQVSNMVPLLL